MATAHPETHEKRPPTTSHTAEGSGWPLPATVLRRPVIVPKRVAGPCNGVLPDDPYVRSHWVAALGPSAVVDLLRLSAAAEQARPIPQPLSLPLLLSEGLAAWDDGELVVPHPLPRVRRDRLNRIGVRRRLLRTDRPGALAGR
jgi:hypothetical protein